MQDFVFLDGLAGVGPESSEDLRKNKVLHLVIESERSGNTIKSC